MRQHPGGEGLALALPLPDRPAFFLDLERTPEAARADGFSALRGNARETRERVDDVVSVVDLPTEGERLAGPGRRLVDPPQLEGAFGDRPEHVQLPPGETQGRDDGGAQEGRASPT